MSETKKRFKTMIQGKTYVIVGTKSQAHMKAASELVEEQLTQLKKLSTGLDGERRAILMAVNAVSKQLDLQEQLDELQKKNSQLEQDVPVSNKQDTRIGTSSSEEV